MKHPCRNTAGAHRPGPSGELVKADCLYPWAALHTLLGWGSRTVARALRDGLPVLTYGSRRYVRGDALIAFLSRHPLERDGTHTATSEKSPVGLGQQPAGQAPNGDSEDDSTGRGHQ
jgi:hypothetical protein